MSSNTPNLGLLKKDPMVDGNETFNIETMLNENWDKIDEAVGQVREDLGNIDVDIPEASLTEKGIVQLSSATNGTRENVAATEKAVKDAALQAKSYTDQQISLVTETGIPKLVSYPLLVTATADDQKVFEIPLDLFDANTDTLLVAINRAALDPTQYTVTNTVRNEAGEVTQRAKITLLSGVTTTSEVTMVVLKNVPIGPNGSINGAALAVNSVPVNRVSGLQDQLDEVFQAGNERKAEVVAALVALGIQASTSEPWVQLIPKIAAIIRASGNATAADLLVGKSASNTSGPFNGGMPNRSAENNHMPGLESTVWAGDRFFICPPHGYYDGSTWVTSAIPGLMPENLRAGVNVANLTGTLKPIKIDMDPYLKMYPAERVETAHGIRSDGNVVMRAYNSYYLYTPSGTLLASIGWANVLSNFRGYIGDDDLFFCYPGSGNYTVKIVNSAGTVLNETIIPGTRSTDYASGDAKRYWQLTSHSNMREFDKNLTIITDHDVSGLKINSTILYLKKSEDWVYVVSNNSNVNNIICSYNVVTKEVRSMVVDPLLFII
ncbi:phage tail protein [Paenibacillus lautus]|uniref:phage tail protein n=1 Tax=Paenibacillus lautus TaxID=1401 RepID=UPI00398832C9